MSRCIAAIALFTIATIVFVSPLQRADAETIFLGPIPYLSAADSPFDLSGLGETFFLEDFEDGELNTPGIFDPAPAKAVVLGPSTTTDSVDADDGVIDGFGRDGFSLSSSNVLVLPIDPGIHTQFIYFGFDRHQLGGLPTVFGFVWTDGGPNSRVSLTVYGPGLQDDAIATAEFDGIGDSFDNGGTAEDRFIGVVSDQPIAFVSIASTHRGEGHRFEIDHVQYGHFIPEPSGTAICVLVGLSTLVYSMRRTALAIVRRH